MTMNSDAVESTSGPGASAPALGRLASPSVAVVICNHNYARYLPEAITSALVQVPPCQVIVVDDGSTDGSRGILEHGDPRIDVVLQANGGQLAAYNTGFARCSSDVVVFLDADDALLPGALASLAGLFDDDVVKVHFRMAMVDAAGRPMGDAVVPASLAQGDVREALTRDGLLYPSAPGSGNAYRASVLRRLFPLPVDPDDKVGADFFTIYGSVAFGQVAACDAVLGRYRIHRDAQAAGEALVFGNAALGNDEAAKVRSRYARLRDWLAVRTGGSVIYSPQFLDFSVQKSGYAMAVLQRPYLGAVFGSGHVLVPLLRSVWLQRMYGMKKKIGLSAWALLVLLAPRRIALKLARYVCNPASRAA